MKMDVLNIYRIYCRAGKLFLGVTMAVLTLSVLPLGVSAAENDTAVDYSKVAGAGEMSAKKEISRYGMLPIYGRDVADGTYAVSVKTTSSKFRAERAELQVQGEEMILTMTLTGSGYSKIYPGTGVEAAASDVSSYIDVVEDAEGWCSFTLPIEALDREIDCAAFSKKKEKWYDRQILVEASSLPAEALALELPDYKLIADALEMYQGKEGSTEAGKSEEDSASDTDSEVGIISQEEQESIVSEPGGSQTPFEPMTIDREDGEYSIECALAGGSGKVTVNSPCLMRVEDGQCYAQIIWSSSNYDYMMVGGKRYDNLEEEGRYSTFWIPIEDMDRELSVIGDTLAMGDPHEIAYVLTFYRDTIGSKSQMPQEAAKRVVYVAVFIIVAGGILNHYVKKKRRG